VTFGATATAGTLSNFPSLIEAGTAALGNGAPPSRSKAPC